MQIVKWAPVIEKAYIPHMGAELVQHLKGRKGTVLYESCSAWQLLYNTLLERGLPVQEVSFNDNGKPYFTNSKIFFSLSHSHGLCAIAISDITVGVDIEVIKDHYNTHMVERSLCSVAVINIALDIVGVKIWGYRAVCYATLICQILLVLAHYFCTKKMEVDKILPLRDLCFFIIVSVILIPIALILYQSNVIRWGLIGIIVVAVSIIAIVKRQEILNVLKKFRHSK